MKTRGLFVVYGRVISLAVPERPKTLAQVLRPVIGWLSWTVMPQAPDINAIHPFHASNGRKSGACTANPDLIFSPCDVRR